MGKAGRSSGRPAFSFLRCFGAFAGFFEAGFFDGALLLPRAGLHLAGLDVDGDIGSRNLLLNPLFQVVGDGMGLLDREVLSDRQVEVHDFL